ncbi:MAG: prephenate dehydratase domain-containing protein, partial [Clostridia bacterium]
INDPFREKNIINRVTSEVDADIKVYTKHLFDTIFDTSKAYQSQLMNLDSNISNTIKAILAKGQLKFPDSATVACQGVQGSYSSLACEKLFAISDITFFKNFEGVFNSVEKGLCKYGILPIENSSVGSVNAVYDLMKKHNFYIVRSIKLPIDHHLLTKNKIAIKDIKEVVSHEQALSQCSEFLSQLKDVKITVCDNTATAAQMVANSSSTNIACISSGLCSDLYGLTKLANSIQNSDNNYTRFICISKELEIFKNSNKTSIMVTIPHESGSLNKLLSKFTTLGLNLTKLESRPLASSNFEFLFYFDFEGDVTDIGVLNLLADLDNRSQQFTYLGSYNEVR